MNAWLDVLSLAVVAVAWGVYVVRLRRVLTDNPLRTVPGVSRLARAHWADFILADASRAILAVQTLRNAIMASTFLASTAILLAIGTLNLLEQAQEPQAIWHLFNFVGSRSHTVWLTKLLLLIANFVVAFFCFALSIRLFLHAGYHVVPEPNQAAAQRERLTQWLHAAGRYFTLGMRAYYLSVVLIFALFGPILTLLSTAIVLWIVTRLDRDP